MYDQQYYLIAINKYQDVLTLHDFLNSLSWSFIGSISRAIIEKRALRTIELHCGTTKVKSNYITNRKWNSWCDNTPHTCVIQMTCVVYHRGTLLCYKETVLVICVHFKLNIKHQLPHTRFISFYILMLDEMMNNQTNHSKMKENWLKPWTQIICIHNTFTN